MEGTLSSLLFEIKERTKRGREVPSQGDLLQGRGMCRSIVEGGVGSPSFRCVRCPSAVWLELAVFRVLAIEWANGERGNTRAPPRWSPEKEKRRGERAPTMRVILTPVSPHSPFSEMGISRCPVVPLDPLKIQSSFWYLQEFLIRRSGGRSGGSRTTLRPGGQSGRREARGQEPADHQRARAR